MNGCTGLILRLAAAFPKDHVTKSTVTLYTSKLSHLDIRALEFVVEQAIENAKSFPTISEIKADYRNHFARHPGAEERPALDIGRVPMPPEIKDQIDHVLNRMDERAAEMSGEMVP